MGSSDSSTKIHSGKMEFAKFHGYSLHAVGLLLYMLHTNLSFFFSISLIIRSVVLSVNIHSRKAG